MVFYLVFKLSCCLATSGRLKKPTKSCSVWPWTTSFAGQVIIILIIINLLIFKNFFFKVEYTCRKVHTLSTYRLANIYRPVALVKLAAPKDNHYPALLPHILVLTLFVHSKMHHIAGTLLCLSSFLRPHCFVAEFQRGTSFQCNFLKELCSWPILCMCGLVSRSY